MMRGLSWPNGASLLAEKWTAALSACGSTLGGLSLPSDVAGSPTDFHDCRLLWALASDESPQDILDE